MAFTWFVPGVKALSGVNKSLNSGKSDVGMSFGSI